MSIKRFTFLFSILFISLLNTNFVRAEEHAPIATDDWYSADRNLELNVPAPGVLASDSDEDGDPLTAVLDTNPTHGTLNFNPDGAFIYQPNFKFTGSDSFTYHATDGLFDSNIATVEINVINTPPFANDDSYVTARDVTLQVAAPGVLSNDSDPNGDTMYAFSLYPPSNGYLYLDFDGSFSYQPYEGFEGVDWFVYFAEDDTLDSNLATVTITVTNGLPIAADDTYQTNKNIALNIAAPGVLGNDSDPNSDSLTAIVDANPSNGTLTLNSDGSFTYTPNTDYVGTDSFTYHANDGLNDSNIATVNLTVNETCLYCDDFNDGNLDPNWTYHKQSWSESNGTLIGTPSGRTAIAIASPIYGGCQTCSIETKMRSAGGAFNKVWMLGWYVDKKNSMELLMKEESDQWVLKQRVNGSVVAKGKGSKTINPNSDYAVRITFDGSSFNVFVDDFVTPLFTLTPQAIVPVGTVGFKVKNTIGSFDYVSVN